MTIPEITAYVMALSVEDVRRLTATEIMGWALQDLHESTTNTVQLNSPLFAWMDADGRAGCIESLWRPDIDRNQSRMVDIRAIDLVGGVNFILAVGAVLKTCLLTVDGEVQILALLGITPDQESRAALIAHMIHAQEAKQWTPTNEQIVAACPAEEKA